MPNHVVKLEAGRSNTTGTFFMVYANRYKEAALTLASSRPAIIGFDPSKKTGVGTQFPLILVEINYCH